MEENEMAVNTCDSGFFIIDCDEKAEWALGKIRDAREEHDRLMNLVDAKQAELNEQKEHIDRTLERDTTWLLWQLNEYMKTVKVKSTKTRDTYQLLSGKLVRKKPTVEYSVDNAALVGWLRSTGREEYIQIAEKPRWGDLKKSLLCDPESGAVTVAGTGEIVEGVTAAEGESAFDVSFE